MTNASHVLEPYLVRLTGAPEDFDELLSLAKDKRFVLIGEASHGTHEFYQIRAEITKRLIAEQDFMAVAVEADWPDAFRVNRYVRGDTQIDNAEDALSGFKRFPQWMWRNTEVRNFIDWLYDYNQEASPIGFYGLDLYSLNSSIGEVISYLDKVDPKAARRARTCYERFTAGEHDDPENTDYRPWIDLDKGCEQEIVERLKKLHKNVWEQLKKDGVFEKETFFSAEQNARLIKDAEDYYNILFNGGASSWNIRDRHMADTLEELAEFLTLKYGKPAKIIVWAHNSHVGDASATERADHGELTLGQLVRARSKEETLLVGFSTYCGTVTAASDWDKPEENKVINEALPGSVEALFHSMEVKNFLLNLHASQQVKTLFSSSMLQRFIGVIYRPDTERLSHYYNVNLAKEFDAIIHIDKTQALRPLTPGYFWSPEIRETKETYPSGL